MTEIDALLELSKLYSTVSISEYFHSYPSPGVKYYYFLFAEYSDPSHLGDYSNKNFRQLHLLVLKIQVLGLRRTISLRPAQELLLVRFPSQVNLISKKEVDHNRRVTWAVKMVQYCINIFKYFHSYPGSEVVYYYLLFSEYSDPSHFKLGYY